MTKTNIHKFTVTGGFDVAAALEPVVAFNGKTIGFKLPDGRMVRMVVALEVENEKGTAFKYITKETKMAELGFEGLDYDRLDFEEVEQEECDEQCATHASDCDGCCDHLEGHINACMQQK